MPANRFFLDAPLNPGDRVSLTDAEHHHLARVMRTAVGESIEIVNGAGVLAQAKVSDIRKDKTEAQVEDVTRLSPFPSRIILAIPLMRPNKLEWILEKGTELGADAFLLFGADYSEKVQINTHQLERLRNLTISALKQSGRLFLPEIELLPSLEPVFETDALSLFGDTDPGAPSLLDAGRSPRALLITGPERGFSEKERSLLAKRAKGVKLSPHILRAETAPLAGLSILSLIVG